MALSLKEWREHNQRIRQQGVDFELPSGLVVKVRNVNLTEFLLHGGIPDTLTPIIAELTRGKEPDAAKVGAAKLVEVEAAMLNAVCRSAIVYPRVTDNPQSEDEIGVDELDAEDKGELMGLLQLPARKLESFCENQARSMERLRRIEAEQAASEQDDQSEPVGERTNGAARK